MTVEASIRSRFAVAFVLAVAIVVIGALFLVAFKTNMLSQALAPSVVKGAPDEATINAIFGTIQFAVASVSGMIILFGLIISASLGRSVTDARTAARRELEDLAKLYKESIEAQTRTVEIQARGAVDAYLSQNDLRQTLDTMKAAVRDAEDERAKIEPIIKDYYEFKLASKEMEDDYVGPYLALSEERGRIEGEDDKDAFDRENRLKLRNAILLLEDGAAVRKIRGNDAFNAAQLAATLGMSELSHRLAVWANWLHPIVLYQARVLRSEHESGERLKVEATAKPGVFHLVNTGDASDTAAGEAIRESAYQSVLDLLENAPLLNSHLIYSEVWNVSQRAEALDRFIERCESVGKRFADENRYLPSYFYAQLARAYAILGGVNWYQNGNRAYMIAHQLLEEESPTSYWYRYTIDELRMAAAVAPGRDDIDGKPVEAPVQNQLLQEEPLGNGLDDGAAVENSSGA